LEASTGPPKRNWDCLVRSSSPSFYIEAGVTTSDTGGE
jgi:hypothetical protein